MLKAVTCVVLTASGLHGAFAADVNGVENGASASGWPRACETCEWGVRSVEDFIADPDHQHALEGALDSTICAAGSDKGKCKSYVHMAVRRAVEFVEDYASPRMLCKPLCPQQYDASPVVASPHTKLGDWKCPFCEFVAQQADHALQNATTDKEILDFLRNSCQDLPQSFAAQCVEYVNTEGMLLIALLETMPPEEVCETLGACAQGPLHTALLTSQPPAQLQRDVASLLSDVGSVRVAHMCAAPTVRQQLMQLGGVDVDVADPPSEECQICKVAVAEARIKLSDPQFQAALERYGKQLCKELGDYEELCKDSIEQYAPLLFATALQWLQPATICVDLVHVCPPPPSP